MIQSDFGVSVAEKIKKNIADKKYTEEELQKENFNKIFSKEIASILKPLEKELFNEHTGLKTILVCGVNALAKPPLLVKFVNY